MDLMQEISELFIAFPTTPVPGHRAVNDALAQLGETTRDLVGDVTNKDNGAVLEWKLVSVFCRVHGLKTSIALLQELARRNDCITFLHEAQRERFEPEQLLDIVRANFDDKSLRDHIYVVTRNMVSSRGNGRGGGEGGRGEFSAPENRSSRTENVEIIPTNLKIDETEAEVEVSN